MKRIELYKQFDSTYKLGAEIGVRAGLNAVNILKYFKDMHLYLVDPWSGDPKRSERDNRVIQKYAIYHVRPYRDRVTVVKKKSTEFALEIPANYFDFVYIDGDHSYEAVCQDIRLWNDRVRSGDILSGHDYVYTKKHGVKRAVDEYVRENNIELNTFNKNWYWRVKYKNTMLSNQ